MTFAARQGDKFCRLINMHVTSHDVNRALRVVRIWHVEACGWRYCAASGPNNVSCTKKTNTPGVLMHVFPRICGIRRHDFKPTKAKHRSFAGIHFESGCYTRLSLGVLHPHSSESDLQEKLTFGERIGATIHAGNFSIMSGIRVEWQSKWARVEKYGRLLILFILFLPHELNYLLF